MNRRLFSIVATALICTACTTPHAQAHPFHQSIAEADWNAETHCLEFALRVHAVDLEQALRRRTAMPIDLEKTPRVDQLIQAYLNLVFVVRGADGEEKTIQWVGKEVDAKQVWLYFEVPVSSGFDGLTISNVIFFELLGDQVNTINFRIGTGPDRKLKSLVFTRRQPTLVLTGE